VGADREEISSARRGREHRRDRGQHSGGRGPCRPTSASEGSRGRNQDESSTDGARSATSPGLKRAALEEHPGKRPDQSEGPRTTRGLVRDVHRGSASDISRNRRGKNGVRGAAGRVAMAVWRGVRAAAQSWMRLSISAQLRR